MTHAPRLPDLLGEHGLRAVDIAPVEIGHHPWLCLGFEEADRDRGDFMHLAFLAAPGLAIGPGTDLHDEALARYRGRAGVCVRVHSECLLGDALGSTLCDCGDQLEASLRLMEGAGHGVLIYLRQEGRGIGMRAKLAALARQKGVVDGRKVAGPLSPDDANRAIGRGVDERDYGAAAGVLAALGIGPARLVTGNPAKSRAIEAAGLQIEEIIDVWSGDLSQSALRELREKAGRDYRYARLDDPAFRRQAG